LHMGDAVEGGGHHGNTEHITAHPHEEVNTHIELMKYATDKLKFQRGDTLAYLQGTDVHTRAYEQEIGRQLGTMEYAAGIYAAPHLTLNINGVTIWAYHKGVSAGQGQTRGNAMINKMKQVYYQCLNDGDQTPDIIVTAHTHDQHHATWTRPRDGRIMHYLITAPFQDKTRFAFDNLATNKNKVGMQAVTITDGGEIIVHSPVLMASPLGYEVGKK